jgi:hypothetical protein
MRERAAALGGTLDAGPDRGGGWRVHAWLPMAMPSSGGAAVPTEIARPRDGELRR